MDETAHNAGPPPIEPETSKFEQRFLPWTTSTLVVVAFILAALALFISPEWLAMHRERHWTMAMPGGTRKAPNPAILANYPGLPTGWRGAPIALFPGQPQPDRWSVNLATGDFTHVQTDIYLPDVIPINLSRTYSSFDYARRDLGVGWSASYEIYLVGNNTVFSYIDMTFPGGAIVHMPRISPGTSYDATYEHRAAAGDTSDIFDQARLWWHSPWYFSSLKNGTGIVFPASRWAQEWGQRAAIMIEDAKGNVLDVKRDEAGNIVEITSPNGQKLVLTPNKQNQITIANDSHGYLVYYTYDDNGHLTDVTDSKGDLTQYTYDIDSLMLTIRQPDGRIWLANAYDKHQRVIKQTYLDGSQAHYMYTTPDPSGMKVTALTHPDGSIDSYTFNRENALMNHTHQPPSTRAKTQ